MKRHVYNELLRWKQSEGRKPLLLHGARQTGKTWILQHFGREKYDECHYFNFEEDPQLIGLFDGRLKSEELIRRLELYTGAQIRTERHLIIFDEIQACDRALNSLKYFDENSENYHVVAAGSLLGIHLADSTSFPVGKVQFANLYPMSFLEFLEAVGDKRYVSTIQTHDIAFKLEEPFHQHLINRLREYYYIGGMPEAVSHYVANADVMRVRDIQQAILRGYELDFAKHSGRLDPAKLLLIWNSLPHHLSRENKKFVFSALRPGARARNYEESLRWLEAAGLVLKCSCVRDPATPLQTHMVPNIFKSYCMDTGLLGAMCGISSSMLVQGSELFSSYSGAFVENYVAQQMMSLSNQALAYWHKEGGNAEVDFLLEQGGVIPVEVKAGINPHSQSLRSYRNRYTPKNSYRLSLLNFCVEKGLINLPLYAVSRLFTL